MGRFRVIFIVLLCSAVVVGASESRIEKVLKVNDDECYRDRDEVIVPENYTLDLKVPGNQKVVFAHCFNYQQQFDSIQLDRIDDNQTLRINNVTAVMGHQWKCNLYFKDRNDEISCIFNVRVRTNRSMDIATNGMMLAISVANPSISEYDAVAEYHYWDGEAVETSCNKTNDIGGLRMEYYDVLGNMLFGVNQEIYTQNLTFRSLMRSHRNMSYLDCIYKPIYGLSFKYRTYYILKQTRSTAMAVWIDGVKLFPRPLKDPHLGVNVECQTYYVNGQKIRFDCKYNNRDAEIIDTRSDSISFRRNCKNDKNNYTVSVLFQSQLTRSFSVAVSGFEADKILYQYTSAPDEWTIHYQYTNKTLNLICATKLDYVDRDNKTTLEWVFPKMTLTVSEKLIDKHILTSDITVPLRDENNDSTLECRRIHAYTAAGGKKPQSKVIIVFHRYMSTMPPNKSVVDEDKSIPDIVAEITRAVTVANAYDASNGNEGTKTDDMKNTVINPLNPETGGNLGWIIGGTLVPIMLLLGCIVHWYIRNKWNKRNENCQDCSSDTPITHYTEIEEGVMVENNYYQSHNNMGTNESEYYTEIPYTVALCHSRNGNKSLYAEVCMSKASNGAYENVLGTHQSAKNLGKEKYANLDQILRKDAVQYANVLR